MSDTPDRCPICHWLYDDVASCGHEECRMRDLHYDPNSESFLLLQEALKTGKPVGVSEMTREEAREFLLGRRASNNGD